MTTLEGIPDDMCYWCGRKIASAEEVDKEGAWNLCTGEQTLGSDPFMVDVWDDRTPVMMCPGKRSDRSDEI